MSGSDPRAAEVDQAFDRVQEIEWSFAPPLLLHAAAQTGLLGLLAAQESTTAVEAAAKLDLHPEATGKVLRALASLGLLEGEGDRFVLGAGFRPLFAPDSDRSHAQALHHLHQLSRAWSEHLEGFLRRGEWPRAPRTPEGAAAFVRGMRALSHGVIPRLCQALDLTGVGRMLDLGGGLGTYSIELCRRHADLRATVLDTPVVAELAREEARRHGLADRVEVMGGDYLETDLPAGFDLVLLANVLHQESREGAARLVARAAGSLAPGGRVVVVEFAMDESRRAPLMGALFAINMRLFGDTYTESTIREWMTRAGLNEISRTDLSPSRWVIQGRRPGPRPG